MRKIVEGLRDYNSYRNKALEKINKYGGDLILRRAGAGEVYDPETNSYIDEGIEIAGRGIISSVSEKNADGKNILVGDLSIMAVFDSAPIVGDDLYIAGKKYKVVIKTELNPSGETAIYYKLIAR